MRTATARRKQREDAQRIDNEYVKRALADTRGDVGRFHEEQSQRMAELEQRVKTLEALLKPAEVV